MSSKEFINEALARYLENKTFKKYSKLIKKIMADDVDIDIKYNLWTMMLNHACEKSHAENVTKQLCEFYCADENISSYLNGAIRFNPKFNEITIEAKSRCDMKMDYSLYISIPCSSEDANKEMARIKEVLTMILMEAKTVAP